jgi:hypothetical protein
MDENEDNKDRLEKLNEGLYSPEAPAINPIIHRGIDVQDSEGIKVNREWQDNNKSSKLSGVFGWANKKQPIFKKILFASLVFFIVSSLVAAFIYIRGVNNVSPNKIDISLTGPLSVSASNPFPLDLSIINRNNSELINTQIIVDYPEGTRAIEDPTKPKVTELIPIGSIQKGELVKKRSEAILFGAEGEKKNIKITFNYQVPGSTSIFEKTAEYELIVNSAPVTLAIDSVKELNSNQLITFNIRVTSNSTNILRNTAVQVIFPLAGFTFESSNPSFEAESIINQPSTWIIDELSPSESKTFTLTGRLKGESEEDKFFKFVVGSADANNPYRIITSYVTADKLIVVKPPFIASEIIFGFDGQNRQSIKAGEILRGTISFKNNLNTSVNYLELTLKLLDKNLIDRSRIQADSGYYSSLEHTITWNRQTQPSLENIGPGQRGQVAFSLPFITPSVGALTSGNLKNLLAEFDLTIKGRRLSDNNVPEEIISLDSKTIKIGTEADLKSRMSYNSGPFKNTGNIPPKVNQPTTYTVTWSLTNTLNDIKDGKVTALLPAYVSFEGSVFPTTEKIIHDKNTNRITWDVGTIFAGEGYKTKAREVSFKIIFTPSENQLGTAPNIVGTANFEGIDAFTGEAITDSAGSKTTFMDGEPFTFGQDRVIR